jgi:hypothetical protein
VEANEIALQNTQQNFISHWEYPEDLTTREGRMQEEANLDIGLANFRSQHSR